MSDNGRFAYSVFCDDIRYEMGGKYSCLGIYSGELYVPSLPAVLPKLCIAAFMRTVASLPFSALTVRACVGEEVVHEVTYSSDMLKSSHTEIVGKGTPDDPINSLYVGSHISLTQPAFNEPINVSVMFIADGVEYSAGKLRVKLLPASENVAPPSA